MVFWFLLLGRTPCVPSPQSYFGGFFKKLAVKCIGILCGALTISRCGDSTTGGKVLWFSMNEEHKNMLICLRHGDECKA